MLETFVLCRYAALGLWKLLEPLNLWEKRKVKGNARWIWLNGSFSVPQNREEFIWENSYSFNISFQRVFPSTYFIPRVIVRFPRDSIELWQGRMHNAGFLLKTIFLQGLTSFVCIFIATAQVLLLMQWEKKIGI